MWMNFEKSTTVSIFYNANPSQMGFAGGWLTQVIKIQNT